MTQGTIKALLNNPLTLQEAIANASKQISFSAQIIAKDFSMETLKVLIELGKAYETLKATKFLTFKEISEAKDADYVLETMEEVAAELIDFILENSNKNPKNVEYLKYAFENASTITEDRLNKLFNVLTVKFEGKKVDKRKNQ